MSTHTTAGVPPLSKPERGLLGTVALAAGAVGILGLVSSFDAVAGAAERWGFGEPWMLPVGIDVAIPVFTAANLLLIRVNMPLAWVRFVPWVLTFVTCWLNVDAGHGMSAKLAHGTMPLLWVVLSEIAAHVYASRIGAVTGRRMEKIRRSRWLLAPVSTFALWRRMTLWEITSYADAITRERQRQLDRAELRERYGRRWRKRTPRRTRVLLKLGELAPAEAEPEPEPDAADEKRHQEPQERPHRRPRKATGKAKSKQVRTPDELLAEARAVTAGWAEGELTAEAIRKAVRTSQANARTLRDALKAERAAGLPLHAVEDAHEGVAA